MHLLRIAKTANLHFVLLFAICGLAVAADSPPKIGQMAEDFELKSVRGDKVKLTEIAEHGPVVLVVLRGFPGYQCPVCNAQVGQLLAHADKFKSAGSQVVLVYPGPSADLTKRAQEFIKNKTIPDHFHLLVDPDYDFTNAYHLRWDAPNETAYPSTFVIGKDKMIVFAKVSDSHGGRTKPDEILRVLKMRP